MTSMKKKLCVLLTCVNMFSVLAMGIASAEGNIWMNENTDIPASRYKKVAVYPICYPGETDGDYMHDPEYNDLLLKRLNKREKGINWMGFSPMIEVLRQYMMQQRQMAICCRVYSLIRFG